jgi:ecotin
LIAIDPYAPKVDRFFRLGGEPYLIRYNNRLPVVVYVPEGEDVRYRIWRAEPESKEANEG